MLISYNFHEIWIKHVLWFLDGSFICQTFLFLFIYYNLHNRHSIYGDLDSITANLYVDRPKPCSLTGILLQNVIRSSSLSSTSPLLSYQAPGHSSRCSWVSGGPKQSWQSNLSWEPLVVLYFTPFIALALNLNPAPVSSLITFVNARLGHWKTLA